MEWHNKEFLISDDIKNILLCEVVCLHTEVNGLDGYSEEKFRRLLDTSFWLGLYKEKKLIGFVRAVTDKETLCYICDIIIDTKFQRQGLGSWMMNCFLMHPDVCQTSMGLGTQDADYFSENLTSSAVPPCAAFLGPINFEKKTLKWKVTKNLRWW